MSFVGEEVCTGWSDSNKLLLSAGDNSCRVETMTDSSMKCHMERLSREHKSCSLSKTEVIAAIKKGEILSGNSSFVDNKNESIVEFCCNDYSSQEGKETFNFERRQNIQFLNYYHSTWWKKYFLKYSIECSELC